MSFIPIMLLAMAGACAQTAEISINGIMSPLSDHFRVTPGGGIEIRRLDNTLVGIPSRMINAVVIKTGRAYILTQPFTLSTVEDDKAVTSAEPLTIVLSFNMTDRPEVEALLRPIYER